MAGNTAMAEEDAFIVDNVEGGLCVDYTDAIIVGRCYSGRDKDKGKGVCWDSLNPKSFEEGFFNHLRIEESLRAQDSDKGKGKEVAGPSVNMTEEVPNNLDSVYMSSPTVVNSSLWHARLGHVHYKRMLEISKDDLIPAIDENHDKCTTLVM
ncbi:zinc finger, CCHC-type containing protein [Tanacetum coccineum]